MKRGDLLALFWEMVRFGWVGVLTAALYAAQMWALHRVNDWPTWVNATVADGPCLLVNYLLHRSFSFRSSKRHREAGPRYLAVQLTGLGINSGVLWFSVDHMRWPFLPTQLGAIAILALFSYAAQKLWSF
jgi:putative flippase GtrA